MRVRADRAEHELAAVGLAFGDPARADHAAGAAYVLDDDRLPQALAHDLADDTPEHVGGATRRERDHHGDGAGRIRLRGGDAGAGRERQQRN